MDRAREKGPYGRPISAVVGEQLRAWREESRLRQDEVARVARDLGLRWTRATVAAIETGRREVSLGELAALPFLVARFPDVGDGHWSRVSGFMGSSAGHAVALAEDAWLPDGGLLVDLFSGSPVGHSWNIKPSMLSTPERRQQELERRFSGYADAELKVARALGVSGFDVAATAHRLWGRTLTEERDDRVKAQAGANTESRTLQALRGHVTRSLLSELRPAMRAKPKKGTKGGKR